MITSPLQWRKTGTGTGATAIEFAVAIVGVATFITERMVDDDEL